MLKPQITYRTPASIYNGNFEQGPGGWNTNGQWVVAQGQSMSGSWGGIFVSSGNPTSQVLALSNLTRLSAQAGDSVTGSAYILINTVQPSGLFCALRLNFWDINGTLLFEALGTEIIAPGGWELSSITFMAPASTSYVTVDIAVTAGFVGGAAVDNVAITGAYTRKTLEFVYPPTSKPITNKAATRTDTFSTAGVRQTVVQRVNEVFPIQMKNILAGDDADAWKAFLDFAADGSPFEFYPDDTNMIEHFTMFISDTTVQLAFGSAGIYTYTGNFQKEITA